MLSTALARPTDHSGPQELNRGHVQPRPPHALPAVQELPGSVLWLMAGGVHFIRPIMALGTSRELIRDLSYLKEWKNRLISKSGKVVVFRSKVARKWLIDG
jgi:hypothetical protein